MKCNDIKCNLISVVEGLEYLLCLTADILMTYTLKLGHVKNNLMSKYVIIILKKWFNLFKKKKELRWFQLEDLTAVTTTIAKIILI